MKNPNMRQILAVVVILLFIGVAFALSVTAVNTTLTNPYKPLFNGDILYVGGSGPNNYSQIQDAIDDASDGDKVFVYDDSSPYNENILINKLIHLIGENRTTTKIDGGYQENTIIITADYCILKNFYIIGEYGLRLDSSHNQISWNIFRIQNACIKSLEDSSIDNNTISHNILIHNDYYYQDPTEDYVIYFGNSHENILINNEVFSYYDHGFMIIGDRNTISNNTFLESYYYPYQDFPKTDIYIEGEKNWIFNNTLNYATGRSYNGIRIRGPGGNNVIQGNIIGGYERAGIYIDDSDNNSILENQITHCDDGIYISLSQYNKISKNYISFSGGNGIILFYSRNTNISYNTIYSIDNGIDLYDRSRFNKINNNNFLTCDINAQFFGFSSINNWNGNYWDEPRNIPYPIYGYIGLGLLFPLLFYMVFGFPIATMINFDWHPASEPYDIGG